MTPPFSAFSLRTTRPIRRTGLIIPASPERTQFVRFRLASADPRENKRGLQDACELLETGHAFLDNAALLKELERLISSSDPRVRRWCYKLAALIKDDRALPSLVLAFESEPDPENQSWIAAALFSIMHDQQIAHWLKQHDQRFFGTFLELAARLFARTTYLEGKSALGRNHFDRDPMVRKWTSLLCGYRVEIPQPILGHIDQLDLVGNLAEDDDHESVEYAIWAHHRNPDGSDRKLTKSPRQLLDDSPPNVRRWVLRVVTKELDAAKRNKDIVVAGIDDSSIEAREGLALGLGRIRPFGLQSEIRRWFKNEQDTAVCVALVDHIARCASTDPNCMNELINRYAETHDSSVLCRKIETALAGESDAKRRLKDIRDRFKSTDANSQQSNLPFGGNQPQMVFNMVKISNSTLSNVAINVEEISNSIIGNVNGSNNAGVREMSDAVRTLIKALNDDTTLDKDLKNEVLNQLNDFSGAEDEAKRHSLGKRLLLSLNGLLQLGANAGTVALAIEQFAPKLQALLG
ncbi:HEAT repeat domain-containing protein [Bradyrhizobium sp. DN5]|uniref:HEAT repeat domain-containing protein n=1 Tax=Bradyrhizobium sp. DN5 TaxID=3056950 RepID=UPI003526A2FF